MSSSARPEPPQSACSRSTCVEFDLTHPAPRVHLPCLTIRSSGPLRRVAVLSGGGQQRPLNSSVRPHKRFLFSVRSLRHVGFCSLAAVASLLAWLACAAVHVSGCSALAVRARVSALLCALCAPDRCATREVTSACSLLGLGSAVPSAGHNRVGCLPG